VVSKRVFKSVLAALLMLWLATSAVAQNSPAPTAEPSEANASPGPSRAEIVAKGYLRTLWAAQEDYHKKDGHYATSLRALVGHGSFTKRMAQTDRRDYTVQFRSDGSKYSAELIPKQFDSEHPAFYMDQSGAVRSEQGKEATSESSEVQKSSRQSRK